jgi:hypothetical protein
LLAGFAAVPVAALPPPAATPDPDAELIRLCDQHSANVQAYNDGPDRYPDDPDPLGDILDASRDALLNTRAKTMDGVLAKARLATRQAEIDMLGDDWDSSDAGTWAQSAVKDLLRLFGEG